MVLLVDQSYSMNEHIAQSKTPKSVACAETVNRVVAELCLACRSGSGIKPRVHLGIVVYGARVGSGFSGPLRDRTLVPINEVAKHPAFLRLEDNTRVPGWLTPVANQGTPMDAAMDLAAEWIRDWIKRHPYSYPPIVINVTDGAPNEVPPFTKTRTSAHRLKDLSTKDGALIMLSAHLSCKKRDKVQLPNSPAGLPDKFAQFLFDMSTTLPSTMRSRIEQLGLSYRPNCRGFIYNSDAKDLAKLLCFGTTVALH